jgi:hypothetical protein
LEEIKKKTEIPKKVPNVPRSIRRNFVRQLSTLEQSPCVANYVFVLLSLSKVDGAWDRNCFNERSSMDKRWDMLL